MEKPAFEIHVAGRTVAIYANGKVEYLANELRVPRGTTIITNRIPAMIAAAVAGAINDNKAA